MNNTLILNSKVKNQESSNNQFQYINQKFHESDSSSHDIFTAQSGEQSNDNDIRKTETFPLTKDSCLMGKSEKFARNLLVYEVQDKEVENEEDLNRERSLKELGFKQNEIEGWDKIEQPRKPDLLEIIYKKIRNHEHTNVQIRIGQTTFCCHMLVLQCYSDFFKDLNDQQIVILPADKVTPQSFVMIYEWMLQNYPLIQRDGLLELFTAATFLKINDLCEQCWACIDDGELIKEDVAFMLYLEAKKYKHDLIQDIMLNRIGKFFLTMVASKDFLELTADEVGKIFEKNTIAVHTEAEVLMAAVRWLNHNWDERKKYILEIVGRVRFGLMLPWQLLEFRRNADTIELERVIKHPVVQQMLDDGFSYVTARYWYATGIEVTAAMKRLKLQPPEERLWIKDEMFTKQLECPNLYCISYCSFLDFMRMIRDKEKTYWKNYEFHDINPNLVLKKSKEDVNFKNFNFEYEYKSICRTQQQHQ